MARDKVKTTRRTALKLLGGVTAASYGLNGSVVAEGEGLEPTRNPTLGGAAEWVLQLEDPTLVEDADSSTGRQRLKMGAASTQADVIENIADHPHVEVLSQLWITNAIIVAVDDEAVDPERELGSLTGVIDAHANFQVPNPEPIDEEKIVSLSHGESTYGIANIAAPGVWNTFDTRGSGARVAVLDTGVDPDHPDITLAEDGWAYFDVRGQPIDSEPFDPDGHGTHVSGTATGGDSAGFHIGVAPEAELYHAKVLDDGGSFAQVAAGIQWAVENDADVINMSLGATGFYPQLIAPVRNAVQLGTFVVTSAGNSGSGSTGTPGNIYESFSIGATNSRESVASFSSGDQVYTASDWGADAPSDWPTFFTVPNVTAPGVSVLSALPGGTYGRLSGTSMAAPHTAGIAALAVAEDAQLTPRQLGELLEEESVHPAGEPRDARYGTGIADALRAVTSNERDGTITGVVRTLSGEPVQGVDVQTDYGTTDVSDEDGRFELPVPQGETTVVAETFGSSGGPLDVQVTGETTQNITLLSTVDIQLQSGQRPDIAAAPVTSEGTYASTDIELEVANLESYAVELGADSTDISAAEVTVTVAGQSLQPGEELTFDEAVSGAVTATVEVSDGVTDGAVLTLDHTFGGPGEPVTVTTGPTTIRQDPTPPSFQITEPNFDAAVGTSRLLTFAPVIENTGELSATQSVTFVIQIAGITSPFSVPLQLGPGQQEQLQFPVSFPELAPTTGTQQIITDDDSASSSFAFQAAVHRIQEFAVPDSVTAGQPLEAAATLENTGEIQQSLTVEVVLGGNVPEAITLLTRAAAVPPGESGTLPLEIPTDGLAPGTYSLSIIAYDNTGAQADVSTQVLTVEEAASTSVFEGPIPGTGASTAPTDPDDDGLYEDVDGDGDVDFDDARALAFVKEDQLTAEQIAALDFDGDGDVDFDDAVALAFDS